MQFFASPDIQPYLQTVIGELNHELIPLLMGGDEVVLIYVSG